jgi:hypothetical protein
MEEKVLLPAARSQRGGEPLPIAEKLRLDHGAIAALLVPKPTPVIAAALRGILSAHNRIEEEPGGLYETCDQLAGDRAGDLAAEMERHPPVRVIPTSDDPKVLEVTRRALARAGYDLSAYEREVG